MKQLLTFTIAGIVVLVFGCTNTNDPNHENGNHDEGTDTTETVAEFSTDQSKEIVTHHLNSFGERSLDGIMEDYTEDSRIVTADSTYTGMESIRAFFDGLLPLFPIDSTEFNLNKMVVEDNLAFITWDAVTPTMTVSFGTDTFIIKDGKIVWQTFASVISMNE
jgi:ketosteroid isomerase-like protein